MLRAWLLLAGLVVFGATVPTEGVSQLLSPGRLSAAHSELEGIRKCTECHQLGKAGVSADKCLGCHTEIGARIAAGRGYHATVERDACADCHQDHLGADFQLVRFDERTFDHDSVDFALELSHGSLECRDCHEPGHVRDPLVVSRKVEPGALARTYLGLPTECVGCHRNDSPHGDQFGARTCAECHDAGEWEVATGFDHAQTSFPLEGLHVRVSCAECHGTGTTAKYEGIASSACSDCHSDPHAGAMEGTCARCHDSGGWHSLRAAGIEGSFDHSRTSFPLRGAHAAATCMECHRSGSPPATDLVRMAYRQGTERNAYPIPVADTCASCHVDRHVFPAAARRWIRCADCHAEASWAPSSYGGARHAQATFPLEGAHAAVPCLACHQDPAQGHVRFTLGLGQQTCATCHAADDPHEGRYAGLACETCHGTEAFDEVAFDHSVVAGQACAGCHASDDPHREQFEGRDCSTCHATTAFTVEAFDHSTTRFPLDGAHDDGPCVGCHTTEGTGEQAFVRYRPLGTDCTDCHRSDR